jgi:hypothetical protein
MWISVRSRADGVQGRLEGIPPMRWTDLPPDSGPADGRASALPRGEWEELRRRLERLPEGHPSRPDNEPDATAAEDDLAAEDVAGTDPDGTDLADEESGRPGSADAGAADTRDGKPADSQRGARGPAGADSGHGKPAALGDLGGRGAREPYRPWFSGGEPPEPWFVVEPD